MKKYALILMVVLSAWTAVAASLSEKELKRLQRQVRINGVKDSTSENLYDEKIEVLRFYTTQPEDDHEDYTFRVRVTLGLEDKKGDRYFTQLSRGQGELDDEYTGEDMWEFSVPYGTLEKLGVEAYIVQYGVLLDGEFIVVATEMDEVDSTEELKTLFPERIDMTAEKGHTYNYLTGDGEVETSTPN
jgi:hypothetical protein